MTSQPKSVIKSYFETGDRPTQAQFIDLIDSYVNTSAGTSYDQTLVRPVFTSASFDNITLNNPTVSGGTWNLGVFTSAVLTRPAIASASLTGPSITGGVIVSATINGNSNTISNIDLSAQTTGNLPVNRLNSGTAASAASHWAGDTTWRRTAVINTSFFIDASVTAATAQIPNDDTPPQSNEGIRAISVTHTPQNVNNRLLITAQINMSVNVSNEVYIAALFQDAGASAIQVSTSYSSVGSELSSVPLQFIVTANTVSPTTFSIRAAGEDSGTVTLNGQGGSRKFGGVLAHTIMVQELPP